MSEFDERQRGRSRVAGAGTRNTENVTEKGIM